MVALGHQAEQCFAWPTVCQSGGGRSSGGCGFDLVWPGHRWHPQTGSRKEAETCTQPWLASSTQVWHCLGINRKVEEKAILCQRGGEAGDSFRCGGLELAHSCELQSSEGKLTPASLSLALSWPWPWPWPWPLFWPQVLQARKGMDWGGRPASPARATHAQEAVTRVSGQQVHLGLSCHLLALGREEGGRCLGDRTEVRRGDLLGND